MTRNIVLGNQKLLVNIDQWLQVRDIYYPRVGQYNHLLGHAHRMIIIEGDHKSWINKDEWDKTTAYKEDTLITNSTAVSNNLKLHITFNENVYCEDDIFFRKITIKNNADYQRSLRFCFHHDFHLYGDGIGDTGFYSPEKKAIIHYKKSVYFLIGLCDQQGKSILLDYDIGEHINPEKKMKQKSISQGEVDSIVATDLILNPGEEKSFCYYMTAGDNLISVTKLQKQYLETGYEKSLEHSDMCQKGWLALIKPNIKILDKKIQNQYKRSLLILKTQINKDGAIIAANDSDNIEFNKDTYSYMWPRDGALTTIALIKAGFHELVKPFFYFCRDVLFEDGCLLHKYNPDKTLGSSWHPWVVNDKPSLPIQEDETALVLHALQIYFENTNDRSLLEELYVPMVKPMSQFLTKYRYKNGLPKESYDLWEERRAIFTYTTATTIAGLSAAEKISHLLKDEKLCETCNIESVLIKKAMIETLYNKEMKCFRRGVSFEQGDVLNDDQIDASIYALTEFNVLPPDDELIINTMTKIKEHLWVKTDIGGIARYKGDNYHKVSDDLENVPGNPWFICTLWYAKWLIRKAKSKEELDEPLKLIYWVIDHSLSTGIIPEQLNPYTGEPLSVSPLTWSHSEFVDTVTDYVNKIESMN